MVVKAEMPNGVYEHFSYLQIYDFGIKIFTNTADLQPGDNGGYVPHQYLSCCQHRNEKSPSPTMHQRILLKTPSRNDKSWGKKFDDL